MRARRTAALLTASVVVAAGMVAMSPAGAVEESDVTPDRVITDVSDGALQRGMDVDDDGHVYVVTDDFRIRVFAPDAEGDADPVRTIEGPLTGLIGHDWANIAVGDDGRIYVASYTSPAQVLVFEPGADDDAEPERVITGPSTKLADVKSIAVGADGSIYVVCDDETDNGRVLVFAPDAVDDAAPARVIKGSKTLLVSPEDAAVADDGTLYVTEWNPGFVNVYRPDAKNNVAPFRTIRLSQPQLWQSTRLDLDADGNLYVGGYEGDRVFMFHEGSEGDAEPINVLAGPHSRINQPWNIGVDADRTLYVGNYDSDEITVYEPLVRPSSVLDVDVTGKPKAKKRTVTWDEPKRDGGREVTGYVVRVKKGKRTLLTREVDGHRTRINRRHTRSGKHVVTVTAKNSVGEGEAGSETFKVKKIKPAKVRKVRVTGKKVAKKRTVRWKKPAWTGGAKIKQYRVVVKKGGKKVVVKTVRPGKRKVKVQKADLRAGKHRVIVRAQNKIGKGPRGKDAFRVKK